ncbi:MAG: argininosuccinate lyase [Chloroflexi bacterium]|nr:argininosuccinate lyase [Chloroflexota bacterium]MBT7080441.1 argininosuccinate lyase [Chloroflexota bacterium]
MSNIRDRFKKEMDKKVESYQASIMFDRRLYVYDIYGSIAHASMLGKQGIITEQEAELITGGLKAIREEIDKGDFEFKKELEDIHLNIENRLFEKIGDVAGKLHTARSRNDQVALDMRLYTKGAVMLTIERLIELQSVVVDLADENKSVIIPGYTHLQRAQPILLAHYLLAYHDMLTRDIGRFQDMMKRVDVMPLGSGALAGVPYPIDREYVAKELGFAAISSNSIDAVSDRDFLLEYSAAAAIAMMHISRFAEEMIIWSSQEFGFVEMDDGYATGSSIMPQKKNPDVAELARGKTGRVYGNLFSLLTIMKSLPLAYNKDLQEDKEGFFDTVDTLLMTLEVTAGMIATLKVNADVTGIAADGPYILATDLADYLVGKGLPFRQAHGVLGKLVQYGLGKGKSLRELSLEEFKSFSDVFDKDVYDISVQTSIDSRDVPGGTASGRVSDALKKAKETLNGRKKQGT